MQAEKSTDGAKLRTLREIPVSRKCLQMFALGRSIARCGLKPQAGAAAGSLANDGAKLKGQVSQFLGSLRRLSTRRFQRQTSDIAPITRCVLHSKDPHARR